MVFDIVSLSYNSNTIFLFNALINLVFLFFLNSSFTISTINTYYC
jgi:hypothetical protein